MQLFSQFETDGDVSRQPLLEMATASSAGRGKRAACSGGRECSPRLCRGVRNSPRFGNLALSRPLATQPNAWHGEG